MAWTKFTEDIYDRWYDSNQNSEHATQGVIMHGILVMPAQSTQAAKERTRTER